MEGNLDLTKLSRTVSHALRHEPWLYGLELDSYGWVHLIDLAVALRRHNEWRKLAENDIIEMVSKSDKRRFEIYKEKIRALYGHSLPGKVLKMSLQPPTILFHGTSSRFIKEIKHEGLKPRGRQYVHLSVDQETALLVAKRKQGASFIITVQASKAYQNGINFYQGNTTTWLADYVSADYLNFSTSVSCEPEHSHRLNYRLYSYPSSSFSCVMHSYRIIYCSNMVYI
jgi:putative RNA 2'-phosphotransferase